MDAANFKMATLWERTDDGVVMCNACAHRCVILQGRGGRCGVRVNRGGVLCSRTYGRIIAEHVDPIEKKPLYHFLPDTQTYSIASVGCNFTCDFCQNHTISQAEFFDDNDVANFGEYKEPQEIVDAAIKRKCESISFTYSEPTVFFEYALDVARLSAAAGLKNIFVSNGYMTDELLQLFAPYLDACNIDLKSFSDEFYRIYCGASLTPVLNTLKLLRELKIHVEVTTLVIPNLNDSDDELEQIAKFIFDELGADTPWHVSRFFPRYRMNDRGITSAEKIFRAVEIGEGVGLKNVYAGNV